LSAILCTPRQYTARSRQHFLGNKLERSAIIIITLIKRHRQGVYSIHGCERLTNGRKVGSTPNAAACRNSGVDFYSSLSKSVQAIGMQIEINFISLAADRCAFNKFVPVPRTHTVQNGSRFKIRFRFKSRSRFRSRSRTVRS